MGRKKTSSSSYSFAECEELNGDGGEDDDGARFLPSLTAKRERKRNSTKIESAAENVGDLCFSVSTRRRRHWAQW